MSTRKRTDNENEDLVTICEDCNKSVTDARKEIVVALGKVDYTEQVVFLQCLFLRIMESERLKNAWQKMGGLSIGVKALTDLMASILEYGSIVHYDGVAIGKMIGGRLASK